MSNKHSVRNRICAIAMTAMLVLGSLPASGLPTVSAATDTPVNISLDGNNIKASNVNGLTFKGFGVLSGNSTSALLMDYKSEHPEAYAQLLQVLFGGEHPVIDHVKIEMGNDRNNSTGPDPATMRTADEPANVTRHPGFQLAADAKKINPNLKVSFLRWNAPAWANTNDKIYTWYKNTILAAYRTYGYMIDYVNPGVNESAPNLTWTKDYANRVKTDTTGFNSPEEQALYNRIKIVISDEVGIGTFGGSMTSATDSSLRDAVAVAGYHYNTDDDSSGNFKKLAEQFDKEVWNSEAQATFSNSSFRPNNNMKDPTVAGTGIGGTGGPLEMGNTIIKGFVNSRRTHFVYQPAIGSFYEGAQYSSKELVGARDPWSGWIHYDAGLAILQHFSWFANLGWENGDNTAGIWRAVPQSSSTGATGTNPVNGRNGAPSYMTLAAPDKSNFSTVIINDSEYDKTYTLQASNMSYTGNPSLEVWETRAADKGTAFNSNYMKYLGNVSADNSGVYTVHVKPYSIVTVTTLQNHEKAAYNTPLPVEGERTVLDTDATGAVQNTEDKILYADDFDYSHKTAAVIGEGGQITGTQSYIDSRGGSKSAIPRYTHDLNGAFEAYLPDGSTNYVLRQQLDQVTTGVGGAWNGGDPVTAIGDNRWTNYKTSIDVSFENNSTQGGANYAAIGARYQGGSQTLSGSPYVLKYWLDGGWQLLVNNSAVASGNVVSGTGGMKIDGFNAAYDAWHNLSVQVAGDQVTAYLDSVKLASYTDPIPELSGRVELGSGFYNVRFDNLKVETVDGYAPYYSELLDNLEMYDLAPVPNPKLIYNDLWTHANGQGMYIYQRSLSTSQGAGATMGYTFTGTGLDILGPNDGSAKLEVTVDGQVVMKSASTMASKQLYQTFMLRGLKYGQHTVQVKVVSGTLAVDAVAVVSGQVKGTPDTTALQGAVAAAQAIVKQDKFLDSDWQIFTTALSAAMDALDNQASDKLDQEGVKQLVSRLAIAQDQLLTGDLQQLASPLYAAAYAGKQPKLPETVEATRGDGSKVLVPVKWNLAGVNFDTPYSTVAVTGTYGTLSTTCYVEVVPKNIRYFVNLNATAKGLTSANTSANTLGYDSPAYTAIAALAGASGKPLLNNAPDTVYNSVYGWGHAGQNASGTPTVNYKGIVSGTFSKLSTTGIYTANQNNAFITYTFGNLPAGQFTLTLGSYSWWPSSSRTEDIYLVYDNSSVKVDSVTLNSSTVSAVKSYTITKTGTGPLMLKLVAVSSGQSPILSFVGVSQAVPQADKTALQALYDQYKETVNNYYTEASWSSFQQALAGALTVLGDDQALQEEIDIAQQALSDAVKGLEQSPDTVKPAIALNGDAVVNLLIGAEYTDAGVTATDDRDGDITSRTVTAITYNGNVVPAANTVTEATYVYHYNVSDNAGNAAEEATRTVIISANPDTVKPVITLKGDATVKLAIGDNYTDAGATAADDRDGDITNRIVTTISNNMNSGTTFSTAEAGTYTFHYNVSDAAGNAAAEVTRTVIVDGGDHSSISNPPPTSPVPSQEPTSTQVLTREDFKAAATGTIAAQISDDKDSVLLPSNISEIVGDKNLRLIKKNIAIEFSSEALKKIQGAVTGAQAEGARINFSAAAVSKDATTNLINNSAINGSAHLATASDVYSFNLNVVSADGTAVPVTNFSEPLILTFKVNPNANSDLLGVYNIAADGTIQYVGGTLVDGIMTVKVKHFSQYAVLEYNKTFSDVSAALWASDVIKKMAAKHIIEGVTDTKFNPQGNVTRAEFAAMIARTLGLEAVNHSKPKFKDVDSHEWYAGVVAAVSESGIVLGRGSDTFAPNAVISREEMAVMTVRAYEYLKGIKVSAANPKSFSDYNQINPWAQNAVSIAQEAGLIKGRGNNKFSPQEMMTRAESAQVVSNLLED